MPTLDEQIAELETVLNNANTNASVDGQSVGWDLKAARQRLSELKAQKAAQAGGQQGFGVRVGRMQYGDANGNI